MGSLHDPCEPRKPLPGRPGDPAARLACRRTRGRATAHVHSPPAAQDRTVEPPLPPGQRARARLLPDVRLTSTTLEALDQLLLGFSRTMAPFGTRQQLQEGKGPMDIPRPGGTMTTEAAAHQRLPWTSVSLNVASTLVERAVERWPLPWHWLAAAGVALALLVLGASPAQAVESRSGPRTSSAAASVTPASHAGRQGVAAGPAVNGPATVPPAASRPAAVGAAQPPAAPPPVVIPPPAGPPISSNPGVPAGGPHQPPPRQRPPHPTPAPQHHGHSPSPVPAGIPAGMSVQPPA